MKWWETWPDRYEKEIAALREKGWAPDDVSSAEELADGYRVIAIQYPISTQYVVVRLRFPPEYPFFMAHAYADAEDLPLHRHHNPLSGEICLLQGGASWRPRCLMADIVESQMPQVLQISDEPFGSYAKEAETPQGEPISGYLSQNGKTLLVVEDVDVPQAVTTGKFLAAQLPDGKQGRYAVIEVRDKAGAVVSRASERLRQRLKDRPTVEGMWRRFDSLTPKDLLDPKGVLHAIDKSGIERLQFAQGHKQKLLAAIYPEERQQHQLQDAWYGFEVVAKPQKAGRKGAKISCKHIPAGAYSFYERTARSPELRTLQDAHICLIGVGMIGSPVAIQLARAGVGKLTLVDHDHLELATTVRYALGTQYAGWAKVDAVRDYIAKNYPLVEVVPLEYRLGHAQHAPGNTDFGRFANALEDCDLIIDAAAEPLVSHYLSQQVQPKQKPLVVLTTSPGSWGGEVWNIQPSGPCWECFERYQMDGTLPTANADASSELVQVGGCTQPTAVGYGFDSDMITLNAVKLAAGLLTDEISGYPSPEWNALIINLRDSQGRAIAAQHHSFKLTPHPDCTCQEP